MYDDVVERLGQLGYVVSPDDEDAINFAIGITEWTIKNECNVDEVPEGLRYVFIDMACGEFLSKKKSGGGSIGIDVEAAVKSIKEGDTQITYAVSDGASVTVDGFINMLQNCGRSQFATYRRFKW
jgi:hypothetical protein